MLHLPHPHRLPYAFSDWEDPQDYLAAFGDDSFQIPLPPPGGAEEENWSE